MPQLKAGFKAVKVSKKKFSRNQRTINELKTLTKKFNNSVIAKNVENTKELLSILIKKINKAKGKGIVHKKAASRKISRIMKTAARLK